MSALETKKQAPLANSYFVTRNHCPACHSKNFSIVYSSRYDKPPIKDYLEGFYGSRGGVEFEYLAGVDYTLCKCSHCHLFFQRDIPNDELMERLYERWIDPAIAHERHKNDDNLDHFAYYAKEIMQVIAFFKKTPSSLRFFDFGMGWGKWALMAKAFGCESYGAELSEERIKHAQANGIKVISWEEIPEHQFDFINTEQVFEHIPQPLETLRYLTSGLKKGGVVKISVPTARNIEQRLKIMNWSSDKHSKHSLNAVAPLEHINCYSIKSLREMANAAGLEEVVIPMKIQYRYSTNWYGVKNILKNIISPIQLNLLKKRNYLFFQKKN